jgi:hypothetical protein
VSNTKERDEIVIAFIQAIGNGMALSVPDRNRACQAAEYLRGRLASLPPEQAAQSEPALPYVHEGDTALALGNLMFALDTWKATNPRTAPPAWDALVRACSELVHADRASRASAMDDAIAAGDGTLHGAIDHWQRRALAAEQAAQQEPPPNSSETPNGSQEPATSTEQDELDQSVSVAWERFNKKNRELRLRAAMRRMDELGPLPGMISSFEAQMGVLWTDAEWKQETSLWAMAWRAALSTTAPQPPAASPPEPKTHSGDSVGADGKRPAASGDGSAIRASGGGGQ